ncbi:MAG: cohesin domain-containing protein [Coriobacteriia bacterium]|nr:cohesin domain-containing protein [Coriobacteriia bacterium]
MREIFKKYKEKGSKVLALVAVLLLVFGLYPIMTFADPPGTADIYVGDPLDGYPTGGFVAGDEFTVPIMIADNPGFAAFNFQVNFDPTVLGFVSKTENGVDCSDPSIVSAGSWTKIPNTTAANEGWLRLNAVDMAATLRQENNEQNGRLFAVTFQVLDDAVPGDYAINITLTFDNAGNFTTWEPANVPHRFIPFNFTVQDEQPPIPDPAILTVGSVSGSVLPGDSFTVPVAIADNPGFASASFTLGFNDSIFELTSFSTQGSILENRLDSSIYDAEVAYNGPDLVDGNGLLFNANFIVKDQAAAGTYTITIGLTNDDELNFVDAANNALPINFVSGTVIVASDEPPLPGTTIVVGNGSGGPGDTITVPVTVEDNAGFAAAALQVSYDHSLLTFVGIVPGSDLPDGAVIVPDAPENDRLLIMSAVNITGDIKLFDLVFEVVDTAPDAVTTVNIEVYNPDEKNFVNADGVELEVSFEAGTLTIVEGENQLVIPDDLDFPAFTEETTWVRIYNGDPISIPVTVAVAGGVGTVVVYYDGDTTAPTNVGSYAVTVTVSGVPGYRPVTTPVALGTLSIVKAPAPAIDWPTADSITYGQSFADVVLAGGSTQYGSFAIDSSFDTTVVPDAGLAPIPVVFTPNADTVLNFEDITDLFHDVELTVLKAQAPDITVWPTSATTIREGQALSASSLNLVSNEFGAFNWADPDTTPVAPGGSYEVIFIPSQATVNNYEPIVSTPHNVSVSVVVAGDVDGSGGVSAADALRILQHATGVYVLTGDALLAADLDGDGVITAADAILAARKAIGL